MLWDKIYRILCFAALTRVALSDNRDEIVCEIDLDCPGEAYCYKELNICVECTICQRFFRQKSFIVCPQMPEQCGECLPGYHSHKLSDGSEVNTCTLIDSAPTLGSKEDEAFEIIYFWLPLLGITCTIILVVVVICLTLKKCHKCARAKPVISEMESLFISPSMPPPFYQNTSQDNIDNTSSEIEANVPRYPFFSEIEINSVTPLQTQVVCEFDRKVQANSYKIPFHTNEESESPEQAEEVEEENLPEIHDDNTQPSTWRPFPQKLSKAGRKECVGGDLNSNILSTDISDQEQQQRENESTTADSEGEVRHFATISAEPHTQPQPK